MKISKGALALAVMLVAGYSSTYARSQKRGVGEDSFMLGCQLEALAPGVSWYYTWGTVAPTGYQNSIENVKDVEFVPMVWNANYDPEKIREYVKAHPGVRYILGFNEPNFTKQANMTPAEAAENWPAVRALATELGLRLVSPALNYSPNPPYQDPLKWMDEFVALVGEDAFDAVAIHNYGGLGVMKTLGGAFHEKYGKPVLVTEFCYWPNEGDPNSSVPQDTQIGSMLETVEWLEKTDWIERYAWFKPIGQYDAKTGAQVGPRYGLLEMQRMGQLDSSELSEQGYAYVYAPDFNPDDWHKTDETVSAARYCAQKGILLGKSNDPSNPVPAEITRFTGGSAVDYQFEIDKADDYVMVLTVSGQGEPVRFDPSLAIVEVDADGNEGAVLCETGEFTLPGDNSVYRTLTCPVTLPAGKQILRLKDMRPSNPSGIHIATLRLVTAAGVGETVVSEASLPVDVHTLSGVRILSGVTEAEARASLPAGFYIIGSRKVRIVK